MATPPHRQWSEVIRLTLCAALMLGLSGCAMLEELAPPEPVGLPVQEAPKREAALVPGPVVQSAPALPDLDEPAEAPEIVKPREVVKEARVPLKEVLRAAPKKRIIVQSGDTLGSIAQKHQVTLQMLKSVNGLDTDRIRAGQRLFIPSASLRIEIDKSENQLRLFSGQELVRSYPVATGDQGVSPTGTYTIANRLVQPTWYWQGYAVTPDDLDYPLGTRWLGLSKRGYGIHGTNEPDSIGKQASHGCVRMHNEDVEELFEVVSVGTPVAIVE